MSDEDELEEIRRRKLAQLQQQGLQEELAKQEKQAFENQKYLIMRKILDQEGRQRLENIRMVKPQFAEQIELQLIQLYQTGQLRGRIPLPDKAFKRLLEQVAQSGKKKDFRIKNF
ncbi:MAG: DNA-binding protein [Promethearchaeota archaeon]